LYILTTDLLLLRVALANDRPVLSSERAPHINKPSTVIRTDLKPQMGGLFQDRLAD
jgi:hypothetical protein